MSCFVWSGSQCVIIMASRKQKSFRVCFSLLSTSIQILVTSILSFFFLHFGGGECYKTMCCNCYYQCVNRTRSHILWFPKAFIICPNEGFCHLDKFCAGGKKRERWTENEIFCVPRFALIRTRMSGSGTASQERAPISLRVGSTT